MKDTFDKPLTGRSEIREDADGLCITLPTKKRVLTMIFISAWLCGWAIGWLAAVSSLVGSSAEMGGGHAFVFFWLIAWTAGGVMVMIHLGWMLCGRELITVDESGMILQRVMGPFKRQRSCSCEHISHIRVVEADTSQIFNRNGYSLFSGFSHGAIRFDYGYGTLGFGLEMDAGEAKQIIDRICARFPQLID